MMKAIATKDEFVSYFLSHNYDENMFNKDGSLNIHHNSFKKTGLIAEILENHFFSSFYPKHKVVIDLKRPNAPKEIQKIIDCYNKNLGCSIYICPECKDCIFVGHTCKSRLCSSCGYKYKMERVENILETAYNCKHRHLVFTIPDILRKFFYYPFENRINILFEAVNMTLDSLVNESFKKDKKNYKKAKKYINKVKSQLGFFAFLHTFGRDLKWNPHIHVLLAEMKITNDKYEKIDFFCYESLRKRFRRNLLDLLEKELGPSFKEIKKQCYSKKYENGFYVYAKKNEFKSLKAGVEYVTRYCGRPPISENRIINYDGKNVTFSYNAHEDGKYHEKTVPVEEFIMLLVNHIIPSNFKTIRYYGFYRKKPSIYEEISKMIKKEWIQFRRTCLKYKMSILKCFNRDPYRCPKCNTKMNFLILLN